MGLLAPSENFEAFLKLFKLLKILNYPLRIIICDDQKALQIAAKLVFPKVKIQLCHTHYLENIRQDLQIRTEDKYHEFFFALESKIFKGFRSKQQREANLFDLYKQYAEHNEVLQHILIEIFKRQANLFAFEKVLCCPRSNNIIESYNSQLQLRLKSIKGFQSFQSAERWLNGWMLRRRTKPFTDCEGRFTSLNRRTSLEMSIKKQADWPEILGVQAPQVKR